MRNWELIERAIRSLRSAREDLVKAGAPRAADKTRAALKSAEGARRHAEAARTTELCRW